MTLARARLEPLTLSIELPSRSTSLNMTSRVGLPGSRHLWHMQLCEGGEQRQAPVARAVM